MSVRERPVLVGQAPGPTGGEGETPHGHSLALFPLPSHSAGGRLKTITGWSNSQYIRDTDRVNLLPRYQGPARSAKGDAFNKREARDRAEVLLREMNLTRRVVVFVGRATVEAFHATLAGRSVLGRELPEPFIWRHISEPPLRSVVGRWAWVPHTSGLNRFWNEPENLRAGHAFFKELGDYCFGGSGELAR